MVGLLAVMACDLSGKNIGDVDDGGGSGGSSGSVTQTETTGPVADSGGTEGGTAGVGLGGVCEGGLSDSYLAWETARDGASNDYSFVMRDTIVHADFCSGEVYIACETATTLTVEGGVVVARSFEATPASEDTPPEDCPEPYTESGDELGSHADGYMLATLDDVYLSCCDMAQMQGGYQVGYGEGYDPGDVVVELHEDSLLRSCTTQYCDDCGCSGDVGISIESIDLGS
ncbi:MAG: hypothetical protein AB1Z98_27785 [Nannocystaceae bacterium]